MFHSDLANTITYPAIAHVALYDYFSIFFFFKIMYTAFFIYILFVPVQSVGSYFGFMQCTAPVDSEFALSIGSLFSLVKLNKLRSFTVFFSPLLLCQSFIDPIYRFHIKNKLLRIQKSAMYLKNIYLSQYSSIFFRLALHWLDSRPQIFSCCCPAAPIQFKRKSQLPATQSPWERHPKSR